MRPAKRLSFISIVLAAVVLFSGCSQTASMLTRLKGTDVEQAKEAIAYFAELGPDAVDTLAEVLTEDSVETRVCAIAALARIDDSRVLDILLSQYDNGDSVVRTAVLQALTLQNNPNADAKLVELLKSAGAEEQEQFRQALTNLGEPAIRPLLYSLQTADENYKALGVSILSGMGAEAVRPILSAFLADPESPVCVLEEQACVKLEETDAALHADLIARLRDGDSGVRWDALWETATVLNDGLDEALIKIAEASGEEPPFSVTYELSIADDCLMRLYDTVMEILYSIGDTSIDPLLALAEEQDTGLRLLSVAALCKYSDRGDERINSLILDSYANAGPNQYLLLQAFGNIDDPRADAILFEALNNESEWVRQCAGDALAKKAGNAAVANELIRLSREEGNDVLANAANGALEKYIDCIPPEAITALMDAAAPMPGAVEGAPRKAVVIDTAASKLSKLFFRLPDDSRASGGDFSDADTVVQLEYGEELIGSYTCGTLAYIHTCTVSVMDLFSGSDIAVRKFEGAYPPDEITYTGTAPVTEYGPMPNEDELLAFITESLA